MGKTLLAVVGGALAALTVVGLGLYFYPHLQPGAAASASHSADNGLFCKEHGVPEAFCTLCHKELNSKLLLCPEHGNIPEDICTLCHPEVEQKHKIEMCPKGHKLPKYFCIKCGMVPSASLDLPDDGWCDPHNRPESLCGECGGEAKTDCRKPLPWVRLAKADTAHKAGIIETLTVEETHAHYLTANAETAYNANRRTEVHPRAQGLLGEVKHDLGETVKRGDVLAIVDSAEIGASKTKYLSNAAAERLTRANYERIKSLADQGAMPAKQRLESETAWRQAEAAYLDSEQKLRNFGLDSAGLSRILQTRDVSNSLEVVSPINGTIVSRHAVPGEPVASNANLFEIVDLATLWVWIDLLETDVRQVQIGQPLEFQSLRDDNLKVPGKITWIAPEANLSARTFRARAELDNSQRQLRAGQFGKASIQIEPEHRAIIAPKNAIQRKDQTHLVFVPREGQPGHYRPQRVLIRPTSNDQYVEVVWGLNSGQKIVSQGSFLLKTEILKGAIGAGCCE